MLSETKNSALLQDYKNFISDVIQKEMVIIGPQIAYDKASNVAGLSVDTAGTVISLNGDPYLVVKNLLDEYAALSQPVTQSVVFGVAQKYPTLKEVFSKSVTKIDLISPIKL